MLYCHDQTVACFYPTKTLFIDDKKEFLEGIALHLESTYQKYDFFDNAYHALVNIKNNHNESVWYKKCKKNVEEESFERRLVEVDVSAIYKQVFNLNRFNTVTTVVVDYDMPGIDGLSFCQHIANLPIFKVLLTGAADEKLAVEAFNSRLIDAFLPKHEENIYSTLQQYIRDGSKCYFQKISNQFFMALEGEKYSDFITDMQFSSVFREVVEENHVTEFYLIEGTGSYLFVTQDKRVGGFFVVPENHLESIYIYAEENSLNSSDLLKLKKRQSILCHFDFHSNSFPTGKDLSKCLLPAKEILLNGIKYYCAYRFYDNLANFLKVEHQFI